MKYKWNFLESNYKGFYEVTLLVEGLTLFSFIPHGKTEEWINVETLVSYALLAYIGYLVYFTSKAISRYGLSEINKTQSSWKRLAILILMAIPSIIYMFTDAMLSFLTPWKYTGATVICLTSLMVAFLSTDPNTILIEKVTPYGLVTLFFSWSICVWLTKTMIQACIPLEWDKEALAEMDDDELEEGEK